MLYKLKFAFSAEGTPVGASPEVPKQPPLPVMFSILRVGTLSEILSYVLSQIQLSVRRRK